MAWDGAQPFAGGKFIVWHPELGACEIHGLIAVKWLSLGREQFGYPTTDELGCPDGRGRFNHFAAMQLAGRPPASIYWTPVTAAHEVQGAIRPHGHSTASNADPSAIPPALAA